MKNISVIFLSLFALTFGLCGNAVAGPVVTSITANQIDAAAAAAASSATTQQIISPEDVAEIGFTCATGSEDECIDTAGRKVFAAAGAVAAIPVAVTVASAAGVTASTGTAIATLSGAAATTATSYAVGSAVVSATGGAAAVIAAPAVIGAAVIAGAGAAVGGLIWWCIKD